MFKVERKENLLAIEKYPEPDPLNIGTEEEVKIKDLVSIQLKRLHLSQLQADGGRSARSKGGGCLSCRPK